MNDVWFVYYNGAKLDGEYGYDELVFVFDRPDTAWVRFVELKDRLQWQAESKGIDFKYLIEELQVYMGSEMSLWFGKGVN